MKEESKIAELIENLTEEVDELVERVDKINNILNGYNAEFETMKKDVDDAKEKHRMTFEKKLQAFRDELKEILNE